MSAAANGADLIILAEAQRLGVATHVVLPLPTEAFLEASVAGSDPAWVELYRTGARRRQRPRPISTVDQRSIMDEDPEWYLVANGLILERARERSPAIDEAIVATHGAADRGRVAAERDRRLRPPGEPKRG